MPLFPLVNSKMDKWLMSFDWTKNKSYTKKTKKNYFSLGVSEMCNTLNIILVRLYLNSTFLLQPACFKSLKTLWKQILAEFKARDSDIKVKNVLFAGLMEKAFKTQK